MLKEIRQCRAKKKILLIAVDNQIRTILEIALSTADYDVSVDDEIPIAENTFDQDLTIVHINLLQEMSLLRELRKPIIILSPRNNESQIVQALNTGADDYIISPFEISELYKRIENLLNEKTDYIQLDYLMPADKIALTSNEEMLFAASLKMPEKS